MLQALRWSPILKKDPISPFNKISFGPVGQSVEITYFLIVCASRITFGKPSNFDVRTKRSEALDMETD